MNSDIVKLLAITAGTLISAPFVLASMRAFFFFGQMSQAIKTVQEEVNVMKRMVTDFVDEMRKSTRDHERRITVIESERRIETRERGE